MASPACAATARGVGHVESSFHRLSCQRAVIRALTLDMAVRATATALNEQRTRSAEEATGRSEPRAPAPRGAHQGASRTHRVGHHRVARLRRWRFGKSAETLSVEQLALWSVSSTPISPRSKPASNRWQAAARREEASAEANAQAPAAARFAAPCRDSARSRLPCLSRLPEGLGADRRGDQRAARPHPGALLRAPPRPSQVLLSALRIGTHRAASRAADRQGVPAPGLLAPCSDQQIPRSSAAVPPREPIHAARRGAPTLHTVRLARAARGVLTFTHN